MAVRSVVFDIIGKDNASRAFLSAARSAEQLGTSAERSLARFEQRSARVQAVGQKLSKSITLPVVAATAVALDQAKKFEQATNVYVTAAGESSKNLATIRKGIEQIGKQTGTSMDQLTSAEYLAEKAGLRGAAGIKVLGAAAKGAREENANLSDVMQAMTSVMASYHLNANQSVQVMNALKTGAGQAKVTMEQYAASLSSVIPIASANKISLEQVLGAMSTLTQHGTSADEATQELASTIRSLAAPNRVAQNQMQQLGLSVNDVTKNIGKRGLTGTIQLLNGAIFSHMGKAGLVVQKAFNQSASATHDAQVMIEKMPPSLAKVARQFEAGKITAGEWTEAIKGMPANQAALAKQFAVTANNANGFNRLLRSGDPAAQTYTSALKKMAGGAIGLNTILQLSGENMAGFKRRTAEVGASLHNSSKEVEGWRSTAQLASVKVDRFKESMRYLAIDAGNALLPFLTKAADGLTKLVSWFDHLSPATKRFIGYSVAIAAALGPVLAILGRFGRLLTTVGRAGLMASRFGAGFAGAARSVEVSSTRAYGAGARLRGVFGGVGTSAVASSREVSAAMASQTRAVATAAAEQERMLAALSRQRMALGAMPVGGAVGRVGGVAGGRVRGGGMSMGGLLIGTGMTIGGQALDDGKAGSARNRGGTALTDAGYGAMLGSMVGPEGAALGALVGGAYGAFKSDTTSLKTFASSIKVIDQLTKSSKPTIAAWSEEIAQSGSNSSAAGQKLTSQIVGLTGLAAKAQKAGLSQKDLTNAIMGTNAQYNRTIAAWKAQGHPSELTLHAMAQLRSEYEKSTIAGRTLAARNLDIGATAADLTRRQNALTAAVRHNGATLDLQTSFGQKNAAALRNAAVAAMTHARAVYAQTGSVSKANGVLRSDVSALEATARAAGLNKSQVDAMVRSILGIPGKKSTDIKVNTSGIGQVQALATIIRDLHDKTVTVYSRAVTTSTGSRVNADKGPVNVSATATGGKLGNGWFTVGEQGGHSESWELGHKSGATVKIYSNAQSKQMTGWDRVPGFAKGTEKFRKSVDGTVYTSKTGYENALHRMMTALGTAIGNFLAAGHNVKESAGDLSSAASRLKSAAHAQLSGSTTLLRYASTRDKINARLGTPTTSTTTAYDRLSSAKSAYSDAYTSVRDTVGAVDYTTLGVPTQTFNDRAAAAPTAAGFITGLKATVSKAKTFAAVLRKLTKEGMPRGIVQQLAAAGPDALAQARALSVATPAQLASIKSLYSQQGAAARAGGLAYADAYYKAGVNSAQGLVNGLLSQRNHLNTAISRLADSMVKTLKHKLGIHSPSTVMRWHGQMSGEGFRLGIEDKLSGIAQAGNKIGNHVQPHGNAGGGTGRHVHIEHLEQNFYEQHDPAAAGNAALRRFQAAIG